MLFGKVLPLFLSLRNAPCVLAIMVALPCVISARTIPVSFFFLLICHILSTLQGQYTFASRVQQSIAYESFTTKRRMDLSYLSRNIQLRVLWHHCHKIFFIIKVRSSDVMKLIASPYYQPRAIEGCARKEADRAENRSIKLVIYRLANFMNLSG